MKLGFLASHRGSDVQAVVDACASGRLAAVPCLVISNNADAEVLERARRLGIATCHLSGTTTPRCCRSSAGRGCTASACTRRCWRRASARPG